MATKKVKRARVAAKRALFEAEVRRSGLEAQATDIRRREARKQQKLEEQERKAADQAAARAVKEPEDAINLTRANNQVKETI